jgi:hypothetical protein
MAPQSSQSWRRKAKPAQTRTLRFVTGNIQKDRDTNPKKKEGPATNKNAADERPSTRSGNGGSYATSKATAGDPD